jgi:glycosyltransferase involved in cell wall biosynthesis
MLGVRTRLPRVHVFHGCWWNNTRVQQWGGRVTNARITATGVVRESLAAVGAVKVAVSWGTARDVRHAYRLRVDHVVSNPVDTRLFRPAPALATDLRTSWGLPVEQRLAMFIGRDEPLKRFPLAAAASAANGYRLVTAGAHRLGDFPLGVQAPHDLARVLAAVDAVVVTSAYEGGSLALLEGLAVGVPVVMTRTGWIPELLERVPAYEPLTAPVDDLPALIGALACVGPATDDAVAAAADIVRTEHDLTSFGATWERIVNEALRGRPGAELA